ncbi:MAG: aminopeptidase P family N-terminal domain-containing protein, partial [Paludibacteraceae bacterium]|nr:aminopeptidase P family N-terminal domain-containing protein [Paludibacteraceae bacterium]
MGRKDWKMGKNTILQRLERLRRWMGERGVSACVVPQADPHLGEYVDAHWQIRAWFSGFTGSAGTLVVTRSRAALWTDSRYFLQAEKQLQGSSIVLMREGIDTSWQDWLAGHGKVAADARLFSCARWRELKRKLPLYDEASFEELWEDRPAQTCAPAFVLAPALCGEEASAKLQRLRDAVNLKAEKYLLLSSLDAIGWLLNIRGNDLKYSPLLRCYLLVGASDGVLFAGKGALDERVSDYLASLGLDVCDYERLRERLQSLLPDSLSADFAETPAAVAEWTVVTQVTDPVP